MFHERAGALIRTPGVVLRTVQDRAAAALVQRLCVHGAFDHAVLLARLQGALARAPEERTC
jgi:hypothetical protein